MPESDNIENTVPSSPKKRTNKTHTPPAVSEPAADASLAETQATPSLPEASPTQAPAGSPAAPAPKRSRRWIFAVVAGFVLVVALAVLIGVQAGIASRTGAESLTRAIEAETQFQLAQADFQAGRCELARERFVYVSELNPQYPGILDSLSQALLCVSATATPQPDQAGPTPTPDLRGQDQAYADAQAQLAAKDWDALLLTLDTLRTNFPSFNPIEIDGMYYTALRNRGVRRILPPVGDLEGGIYDLNRAAQIGPLDADAVMYRQWAVNYIVGQSFWEVDWEQAVQYFQPLVAAAPNLHDINFFTVQDRLATASAFYSLDLIDRAERLTREEKWCSANELMLQAASFAPLSPEDQATADSYASACAERGDG